MADQPQAQGANQPEQEDHRDVGPLTLDTLPPKIISMILATMTVDPNEPYVLDRSTLKPSATRKEQDASARRDLTSLCLVSKRMASEVRPALYRNLLIRDSRTLVRLYRTFLGKPQFGMLVKRMTLDVCHGEKQREESRVDQRVPDVYLDRILRYPLHGFQSHLTVKRKFHSSIEFYEVVVEKLYTLQFRVLSHTSKLEYLDFNIHPLSRESNEENHSIYMEVIGRVFPLLWDETSLHLSSVKELQLMGRETFRSSRCRPSDYAAWMCRSFLALPKVNRLIWFNHDRGWFDTFPCRMLYGPDQRLSADGGSIRVLNLTESPCLPHEFAALCAVFPSLESLSVDTDSEQCRLRMYQLCGKPLELQANGDTDSGLVNSGLTTLYITDTLRTLKNLTTLNLDLHYACNISASLRPSGTLSLAGLPNLQNLAVPFHFFVKRDPDGHHRAVSPASVLPRSLKTLRIIACLWCLGHRIYEEPKFVECLCGAYRIRGYAGDRAPCRYHHAAAVLGFLKGIAQQHTRSLPVLQNIFYDESSPRPVTHQHRTWECPHPPTEILMSGDQDTPNALRLMALSERLRQSGVLFKMRATAFGCWVPWAQSLDRPGKWWVRRWAQDPLDVGAMFITPD